MIITVFQIIISSHGHRINSNVLHVLSVNVHEWDDFISQRKSYSPEYESWGKYDISVAFKPSESKVILIYSFVIILLISPPHNYLFYNFRSYLEPALERLEESLVDEGRFLDSPVLETMLPAWAVIELMQNK